MASCTTGQFACASMSGLVFCPAKTPNDSAYSGIMQSKVITYFFHSITTAIIFQGYCLVSASTFLCIMVKGKRQDLTPFYATLILPKLVPLTMSTTWLIFHLYLGQYCCSSASSGKVPKTWKKYITFTFRPDISTSNVP